MAEMDIHCTGSVLTMKYLGRNATKHGPSICWTAQNVMQVWATITLFLCLNPIILVVLIPDGTTGSLHNFLKIHRLKKKKELLIRKTWTEFKGIMLRKKCPFQRIIVYDSVCITVSKR